MFVRRSIFMALILLVGVVYVLNRQETHTLEQETKERQERIFPDLTPDRIRSLRVHSNNESYELTRTESSVPGASQSWRLSNDVLKDLAVDESTVTTMVSALANLRSLNTIPRHELEGDLAIYGLSEPTLRVSLDIGGKTTSVTFGKEHPFSGRRYLQKEGSEDVYLIDSRMSSAIDKRFNDVRNRHPLTFEPKDVTELRITLASGENRTLRRLDSENWVYEDGTRTFQADRDVVTQVLMDFARLRASGFIDEVSGTQPELVRDATISLTFGGEKVWSVTFEVGETDGRVGGHNVERRDGEQTLPVDHRGFYLKLIGENTAYEFDRRIYRDLTRSSIALRNKQVFTGLKPENVKSVQVTVVNSVRGPAREYTLIRQSDVGAENVPTPNGWFVREGSGSASGALKKASSAKVLDWLMKLTGLRVLSFVDTAEGVHSNLGLSSPGVEIVVEAEGGEYSIVFGNPVGEGGERPAPQTNPPRYGALQQPGQELLPFIVSHLDWVELDRDWAFFIEEANQ